MVLCVSFTGYPVNVIILLVIVLLGNPREELLYFYSAQQWSLELTDCIDFHLRTFGFLVSKNLQWSQEVCFLNHHEKCYGMGFKMICEWVGVGLVPLLPTGKQSEGGKKENSVQHNLANAGSKLLESDTRQFIVNIVPFGIKDSLYNSVPSAQWSTIK